MAVNVCRLCMAAGDLVWIFDEKNKKLEMQDIISITTGIQIHPKDVISQRICRKCYEFSISIFQFRGQCLKTDKYLKKMCMDYLVDKKQYIPNTEVTIKSARENEVIIKPEIKKVIHPSIVKISRAYPKIKLPRFCLDCNFTPIVELEMDQVENYFKKQKLDFRHCVKKAKRYWKMLESKELGTASKSLGRKNALKAESSKLVKRGNLKNDEKLPNTHLVKTNKTSRSWASIKIKLKESPKKVPQNPNRKRKITDESNKSTKVDESIKSLDNLNNLSDIGNIKRSKLEVSENLFHAENEKSNSDMDLPSSCNKYRLEETGNVVGNATNNSSHCHYTEEELGANFNLNRNPIENNSEIDLENRNSLKNTEVLNITSTSRETTVDKRESNELVNDISKSNQVDDCEDSLTRVEKSKPLFVCQLCNSVQYSMYELKKHQIKHMRCQFCKVRCRSLEQKRLHIQTSCAIKKMMIDLPSVAISKIDHNISIRQKHSRAFVGFPVQSQSSNPNVSFNTLFTDLPPERLNVIEILSEDDDNEHVIVPHITSNIFNTLKENASDDLKNILAVFQKDSKELGIETSSPNNEDIISKRNAVVLKNLLPYLSLYKIPVKLQLGNFAVSYNFYSKSESSKNRFFWDELTPIDINLRQETDSSKTIDE